MLSARVAHSLITAFCHGGIDLIEWHTALYCTLVNYTDVYDGCPYFLVPDGKQLEKTREIAKKLGFRRLGPTDSEPKTYLQRLEIADCYHLKGEQGKRLTILPLSWSGLTRGDWNHIPASRAHFRHSKYIFTLNLPVACATFMRLLVKEGEDDYRQTLIAFLDGALQAVFVDEGGTENGEENIAKAVEAMRGWKWREEEENLKELLIKAFKREISYSELPRP